MNSAFDGKRAQGEDEDGGDDNAPGGGGGDDEEVVAGVVNVVAVVVVQASRAIAAVFSSVDSCTAVRREVKAGAGPSAAGSGGDRNEGILDNVDRLRTNKGFGKGGEVVEGEIRGKGSIRRWNT